MMSGACRAAVIILWSVLWGIRRDHYLLRFLRLRRDHAQDLRQASYRTRWPNHLTVSLSNCGHFTLSAHKSSSKRPNRCTRGRRQANLLAQCITGGLFDNMLHLFCSIACPFRSRRFWELLATRIPSILSLISWGTLGHEIIFPFLPATCSNT